MSGKFIWGVWNAVFKQCLMWLVSELEGGPSLAEDDDLDGGFDLDDQDSEDDENQDSDSVIQPSKKQRQTALASIENVRLT